MKNVTLKAKKYLRMITLKKANSLGTLSGCEFQSYSCIRSIQCIYKLGFCFVPDTWLSSHIYHISLSHTQIYLVNERLQERFFPIKSFLLFMLITMSSLLGLASNQLITLSITLLLCNWTTFLVSQWLSLILE